MTGIKVNVACGTAIFEKDCRNDVSVDEIRERYADGLSENEAEEILMAITTLSDIMYNCYLVENQCKMACKLIGINEEDSNPLKVAA